MRTTPNQQTPPAFFLGIDVGKKDLFCHIINLDSSYSERFENNDPGVAKLSRWLEELAEPAQTVACLEQTGHYSKAVAKRLAALEVGRIHVVNPRCIKSFAHRKLRRNKSDTADARLIAEFARAEHHELRSWTPRTSENEQITELSRYAESLTTDNARLKTKCEAAINPLILRSLKRRIKAQEREIAELRRRINALIKSQPELRKQRELLSSIPGLGEITCHILIAELPEIDLFVNARQLAAWGGVTPRHFKSGTSGSTKTPITKVGSANLRRALFMPAMTARMNNPLLKEFADRLKENGKKPKQIIIAIMRKLLHQIYGILKSGEPFNPDKHGFRPA